MFTLTVSEKPVNDLSTHTLYLTTSAVNSLPLRRRLVNRKLKESVILPSELSNLAHTLVLRVKHVALNFNHDFKCDNAVVPGSRIIGKLPASRQDSKNLGFSPHDKLMVFPHLTCWIQRASDPCDHCAMMLAADHNDYVKLRHFRCLHDWQYGKTLDGGLQDYISVPDPIHSIVKIPRLVSLHDCCFLFDIALPFYSYCRDVLCPNLERDPHSRILIILNDLTKEANDCLLVIHHLRLDLLLITFTDMKKLGEVPGLRDTYANKFHHVLVFALGQGPINAALELGLATGLELTKSRHTIALFGDEVGPLSIPPPDRTVHNVSLSYKDKLLMEELLNTLADFNKNRGDGATQIGETDSADSLETSTNHSLLLDLIPSPEAWSTSLAKKKKIRFKEESESSGRALEAGSGLKSHISWLHCDRDYRLCVDDHCDHDTQKRCHSTSALNGMLYPCQLRRVFYTNRPASHVKINAFIF